MSALVEARICANTSWPTLLKLPKFRRPGFARAWAISSATDFTGRAGLTTRMKM